MLETLSYADLLALQSFAKEQWDHVDGMLDAARRYGGICASIEEYKEMELRINDLDKERDKWGKLYDKTTQLLKDKALAFMPS